ncbi:hypothetical protein ABW636_15685 [Aquimarina sp. 2201CG1-2-11]|uniref:hypothetical protein n=1 Tax=Aquimarina discodermiae TaxID=3231043 RepID=UPI003462AF93
MVYRKINKKLIKKFEIDIGVVYFYKNYVITEINEGVVLNFEKAAKLLQLGIEYYGTKVPFIYISNRINSYSFEPTSHFKSTEMFPNLKGFGVVIYDQLNSDVAKIEQTFINKPTNIFYSLEEAIAWAEELIIID